MGFFKDVFEFGKNVARGADQWGQHVGQDIVAPAIDQICRGAHSIGTKVVGAVLNHVDKAAHTAEHSGPDADESGQTFVGSVPSHVARSASHIMTVAPACFALIAFRDARTAAALFKVLFAARRIMAWVRAVDFSNITDWIRSHPRETKIVGAGLVAACLCPLIMGPLLAGIGFGAAGPIAGSLAAAIQATLGPVAAGSLFAVLQSAAMGGYGAAIVAGTMSGTSLVVAVSAAIHSFLQTKNIAQSEAGALQGIRSEANDAGDSKGDDGDDGHGAGKKYVGDEEDGADEERQGGK